MSPTAPSIDLAVTAPTASPGGAIGSVAALLDGRPLTPAMGRWVRRVAAVFSSWHRAVLAEMETHPAMSLTDPSMGVEVGADYVGSIVALTRGLGPRTGHDGVVPVAVALVELAGSFGPTFAPLRCTEPRTHDRLSLVADLSPAPFGSASGLTSRFVRTVLAETAAISAPGLPAAEVRRRIDRFDLDTIAAVEQLRRAGSGASEEDHSVRSHDEFEPARVTALAAVLVADPAFTGGDPAGATGPVGEARRVGRLALAASAEFVAVARVDERVAAGLLATDQLATG